MAGYTPGRFPRSEVFELPFFTYDAEGSSRAAWDYIANYAPDEFREVKLPNIVLPFPGGAVRSGSKIGSRYKGLIASTNDAYCPTIRAQTKESALPPEVESVVEIVIDGLTEADVAAATAAGVRAACAIGRGAGVVAISAGNYGGKLGPYHFHLHRVLQ